MKNSSKVLLILVILLIVILALSTVISATYKPDTFKDRINTEAGGASNVKATGGRIVGLIRVVGTIVSVGMLIVLGVKYMMGSAEERAEYKKTLFPYFIGAVLIFAASSLTQIIYNWASTI